jgi:hypothetical protein
LHRVILEVDKTGKVVERERFLRKEKRQISRLGRQKQ